MTDNYEKNESDLRELKEKYDLKFLELSECYNKQVVKYEYSKGGLEFYRGIYTTSLYWQNSNPQKLGRKCTSNAQYDYMYGFNADNKLIYTQKGNREKEYILYQNNKEISLVYDIYTLRLSRLSVSYYYNEKLISIYCGYVRSNGMLGFTGELYSYDNELSKITLVTKECNYYKRFVYVYDVIDNNKIIFNSQYVM
ncbi:MAG: hypothetical protein ACI4J6_03320 [Oscillospiraceae bacterium]